MLKTLDVAFLSLLQTELNMESLGLKVIDIIYNLDMISTFLFINFTFFFLFLS